MQQNDNFKWLRKELEFAYKKARRGKTGKPQVEEFDKNLKKELDSLAQEIYSRKYTPRPSSAFIVNKPVKREIFAADFRDRVVHHFIFNQVNPWWDTRFIEDNYSCRKGKGTLYGIRRLEKHIRSDVIFNCPRRAWEGLPPSKSLFGQPKGTGIAIGNLTSQLLSNVFLDQLDRYITINLGFKGYGRYVDDFYIVSQDKTSLIIATHKIEGYLKNTLGLTLHPHKRHLQHFNKGIEFLGAVVYPFRTHPGPRLKRNLLAALSRPDCSIETSASYRGLVKHYKHKKLLKSIQ